MKTNSKVIQALIKYRITIVCLCFAALMIIGFWVSLIIGATSENNGISKTISNYILTIIFISVLLLGGSVFFNYRNAEIQDAKRVSRSR